jgi:FkbM family methyltransferase
MAQSSLLTKLLSYAVDLVPWRTRDYVRRVPGVAALQRALLSRAMDGAEFVHEISAGPAKGLRFPIRMPEGKLYWTGTYEMETTARLVDELPKNAVCYDIGSHHGFLAGVMAVNGARKVYCFEPNPENIAKIEKVCSLNPGRALQIVKAAVGSTDRTARFEVLPTSSMGKLADSTFQEDVVGANHFDVAVRSLDSMIDTKEIEPADFVKIDIEGAEYDALVGASRLVDEHRPILLIEVHSFDLMQRCNEWLRERRYACRIVELDLQDPTAETFRVCHILARA